MSDPVQIEVNPVLVEAVFVPTSEVTTERDPTDAESLSPPSFAKMRADARLKLWYE